MARIEDAVNSVTTITYNHDAMNQFAGAVDLSDNLSSVGRTTYSYDSAHRLTTMTRSIGGTAGPRVAMGYDAGNRMTSIERTINGADPKVLTTLSYDAANRVTTITHGKATYNFFPPSYVTTPLATYTYGYDDANRVTSETNAEGSVTYAYDSTNQLTTVTGARSESYSYDLNGNRTMSGYTTGAGNQLSAGAGFTFTYDSEGNMTGRTETATGKVTTFAYDHRNRMTGATTKDSGGSVIMLATYTYDALGRRIGTNVDADGAGAGAAVQTWMVYDGVNTYADFNNAGATLVRYLHGLAVDELLARTDSGGATAWYGNDRLGTVRDVVNTSGVVIYHAAYDGYGNIAWETGSGGDRFKFTGREQDIHTGLQYNRGRLYNPVIGRWMSQDPIKFQGGDTNLFRYVANGPTNATDPSGKIINIVGGAIVGGIVGGVGAGAIELADYLWDGDPISVGNIGVGMVGGAVLGGCGPLIGIGSALETVGQVAWNSATNSLIFGWVCFWAEAIKKHFEDMPKPLPKPVPPPSKPAPSLSLPNSPLPSQPAESPPVQLPSPHNPIRPPQMPSPAPIGDIRPGWYILGPNGPIPANPPDPTQPIPPGVGFLPPTPGLPLPNYPPPGQPFPGQPPSQGGYPM